MGPFVEEIRTQEWLAPIHTHQLRFPIPNPFARGEQFSSALMGIGFVLIGIAIYIFFFAESVTFYTPYSVESGGWTLHLPNGIDYSINSYVGISTMIGISILGVLLLMISSALKIHILLNQGVGPAFPRKD